MYPLQFYLKSDAFQNSPKGHQTFWLLLKENLSLETLKIAPSGHTGSVKLALICLNSVSDQLRSAQAKKGFIVLVPGRDSVTPILFAGWR